MPPKTQKLANPQETLSEPSWDLEENLPVPPVATGEPTITFDPRLGKRFAEVTFNHSAYKEMVEAQGGTQEDYVNADIHFDRGSLRYRGIYYHKTDDEAGQIGVGLSRFTSARMANRTLAHETRHYLDDRNNLLTPYHPLEGISRKASHGLMGVTAANTAALYITPIENEAYVAAPYSLAAFIAISAMSQALYRGSAKERRAFKAGRDFGHISVLGIKRK